MNLVVFDLEMNQPSQKIIQIGAVTLRLQQGDIVPLFSEIVNPGETPNGFITQLTGISTEDVESARPLDDALRIFWSKIRNIEGPVRIGAWGSDCKKLYKDSAALGVAPPENLTGYDLRGIYKMYSLVSGNPVSGIGLAKVAKKLNVAFEGHHHNAYDDALVTAKIMAQCLHEIKGLLG